MPIVEETNRKQISNQVDSLLKFHEEIKGERLQTKIEQLKKRIEYSEEKINQLVYELYDLTKDEIKLVEESVKK